MIAHELAHIKNRDTLIMTITATIAGAISMLAQFGMFFGGNRDNNNGMGIIGTLAMVILAPIAAMLVQMAISRTREYAADRMGARDRRRADVARLRARKIENAAHQIPNETAERNPATAHMFIINPLSRPAHGQPVLDPSGDREPHRRAEAACRARWAAAAMRGRRRAAGRAGARLRRSGPWGGGVRAAVRGAERRVMQNRRAQLR